MIETERDKYMDPFTHTRLYESLFYVFDAKPVVYDWRIWHSYVVYPSTERRYPR